MNTGNVLALSIVLETDQPRSQGFSRPSYLQGKSPGNEVGDGPYFAREGDGQFPKYIPAQQKLPKGIMQGENWGKNGVRDFKYNDPFLVLTIGVNESGKSHPRKHTNVTGPQLKPKIIAPRLQTFSTLDRWSSCTYLSAILNYESKVEWLLVKWVVLSSRLI